MEKVLNHNNNGMAKWDREQRKSAREEFFFHTWKKNSQNSYWRVSERNSVRSAIKPTASLGFAPAKPLALVLNAGYTYSRNRIHRWELIKLQNRQVMILGQILYNR